MNITKTIFSVLVALALVSAPTFAALEDGKDICKRNGFSYDAITWEWTGTQWALQYERPGFDSSLTGTQTDVLWESGRVVRAVIEVAGDTETVTKLRVKQGTIQSDVPLDGVVLCVRGGGSNKGATVQTDNSFDEQNAPTNEIPEFGGAIAFGTMGLVGAALVALKRR